MLQEAVQTIYEISKRKRARVRPADDRPPGHHAYPSAPVLQLYAYEYELTDPLLLSFCPTSTKPGPTVAVGHGRQLEPVGHGEGQCTEFCQCHAQVQGLRAARVGKHSITRYYDYTVIRSLANPQELLADL